MRTIVTPPPIEPCTACFEAPQTELRPDVTQTSGRCRIMQEPRAGRLDGDGFSEALVNPKFGCAGSQCRVFVWVSLCDDFLWNCGFVSCCGGNRFLRPAGFHSFSSVPKRGPARALWVGPAGYGGDPRHRADQDWHTESFEVLAIRPHRDVHVRGSFLVCVVAGGLRMARQWDRSTRIAIHCAAALDGGDRSR